MVLDRIPYRGGDFMEGLRRLGYSVSASVNHAPNRGDVLVIWNRSLTADAMAKRYEQCGATVVVVENGYFGRDWRGGHWYAMALGHHNGAGRWPVGGPERWDRLEVPLLPWRVSDGGRKGHILVLPQRGIGERGVAMPKTWPEQARAALGRATERPILVRPHPGPPPHPSLAPALANCHCAVTWGSGAALKALVAGVPVFHGLRDWIGGPAARLWPGEGSGSARRGGQANKPKGSVPGPASCETPFASFEEPFLGDRLPMLRRLAWAMWERDEIRSGEAFAWLLKR